MGSGLGPDRTEILNQSNKRCNSSLTARSPQSQQCSLSLSEIPPPVVHRRYPNACSWSLQRWFRRPVPWFPVSPTLRFSWFVSTDPSSTARRKRPIERRSDARSTSDSVSKGSVGRILCPPINPKRTAAAKSIARPRSSRFVQATSTT